MPFTTGTASDYHDLLDKLRQYLVANGWTQLRWDPPASITSNALLWVRGPGGGAGREAFIGIWSHSSAPDAQYGWRIAGSIAYDNSLTWGSQNGQGPNAFFNTWQNSMAYWFYVNDRRFIVVAKVGTAYMSMYAGFILANALPSEYPFPLYVSANDDALDIYNSSNSGNRCIFDPGVNTSFLRARADLSWYPVANHNNNNSSIDNYLFSTASLKVWPAGHYEEYFNSQFNWPYGVMQDRLRPLANGGELMVQCQLVGAYEMFGALDGVFWLPGFNKSAEQVVSQSGRNFRVFQNVSRSNRNHFFAVEEI